MTFKVKILVTILVVVGFDAVGSLLSKLLQFNYTDLVWASLLIYVASGFWGARRRGFTFGILLGAIAGLVDSTIGWFVSTWIKPFSRTGIPPISTELMLIILITVTVTGLIFGLVGAGLCTILGQARPVDPNKS
jgi:hypothetical protein